MAELEKTVEEEKMKLVKVLIAQYYAFCVFDSFYTMQDAVSLFGVWCGGCPDPDFGPKQRDINAQQSIRRCGFIIVDF